MKLNRNESLKRLSYFSLKENNIFLVSCQKKGKCVVFLEKKRKKKKLPRNDTLQCYKFASGWLAWLENFKLNPQVKTATKIE